MSKTIAVPDELYGKAAELAAREHVSIEQFVAMLLPDSAASREFIESRARFFDPCHV